MKQFKGVAVGLKGRKRYDVYRAAIVKALSDGLPRRAQDVTRALNIAGGSIHNAMKSRSSWLKVAIEDLVNEEVIEITPPLGAGRGHRIWQLKDLTLQPEVPTEDPTIEQALEIFLQAVAKQVKPNPYAKYQEVAITEYVRMIVELQNEVAELKKQRDDGGLVKKYFNFQAS